MTIQELIDQLAEAAERLPNGMDSEVKLASQNYRSMMRYGVHAVAVAFTDIDNEVDKESLCWIMEGAQDRERPYNVPELEPLS